MKLKLCINHQGNCPKIIGYLFHFFVVLTGSAAFYVEVVIFQYIIFCYSSQQNHKNLIILLFFIRGNCPKISGYLFYFLFMCSCFEFFMSIMSHFGSLMSCLSDEILEHRSFYLIRCNKRLIIESSCDTQESFYSGSSSSFVHHQTNDY